MVDNTIADRSQPQVSVPFRILPSTGPRPLRLMTLFGLLLLLGAAMSVNVGIALGKLPPVGTWGPMRWSMTNNGHPSADGAWIIVSIIAAAGALTLFNLAREIVYLNPGSRYWIEITSDGMTLASPLACRFFGWQELPLFASRVLPMRSWRIVRVTARMSWFRWAWIRSDDFATELDTSRPDAAEILTGVLNDLQIRLSAGHTAAVAIPAGPRVAPIASSTGKRTTNSPAVVRQS